MMDVFQARNDERLGIAFNWTLQSNWSGRRDSNPQLPPWESNPEVLVYQHYVRVSKLVEVREQTKLWLKRIQLTTTIIPEDIKKLELV